MDMQGFQQRKINTHRNMNNIRKYTKEDKEEVLNLIRPLVPEYFAEEEIKDFEHYLIHEIEDYFVYQTEDKIIAAGGINYNLKNVTAIISWDMVHIDYLGKGIGRKLVEYRIEFIKKKKNIHRIVVNTSQHTFGFYEKFGFSTSKIKKDFWAEGFDLYQMEFNLE